MGFLTSSVKHGAIPWVLYVFLVSVWVHKDLIRPDFVVKGCTRPKQLKHAWSSLSLCGLFSSESSLVWVRPKLACTAWLCLDCSRRNRLHYPHPPVCDVCPAVSGWPLPPSASVSGCQVESRGQSRYGCRRSAAFIWGGSYESTFEVRWTLSKICGDCNEWCVILQPGTKKQWI